MTRPLAVLRPEPGNAATAMRVEAAGLSPIRLPLFAVAPVMWESPDPAGFDALLVTSANAMRQGGEGLERLRALPVLAVGEATAGAAAAAGFRVALTGQADAAALVAEAGRSRLLHLAGRDRVDLPGVTSVTVYAADPLPVSPGQARSLAGSVALLHSARAARRLGEVADIAEVGRRDIRVAALSEAVARAAGSGWAASTIASAPNDEVLVAAAAALAD